jgi:protoheme IX farnesyltransferase
MLPSPGGRDKASAFKVLIYTLSLVPLSLVPFALRINGMVGGVVILLGGILFSIQAIRLYQTCSVKSAQQLMFGSFFYLPVILLAILLG